MIRHYSKVIRKDAKLIILVVLFIILGFVATMLANQCAFVQCQPPEENPAIVNHPPVADQY